MAFLHRFWVKFWPPAIIFNGYFVLIILFCHFSTKIQKMYTNRQITPIKKWRWKKIRIYKFKFIK